MEIALCTYYIGPLALGEVVDVEGVGGH